MSKLTAQGRNRIKPSNFALPKGTGDNKDKDEFPIHDLAHARKALQLMTDRPAWEQTQIRQAVYAKYPALRDRVEGKGKTPPKGKPNARKPGRA